MSIGNVQAIRDWINTNYYSKQEILDTFAYKYSARLYGAPNESITLTNTSLGTDPEIYTLDNTGQKGYMTGDRVYIYGFPGDTITLKGSVSNQTFTTKLGIDTSSVQQLYCMHPKTLLWYGNVQYTTAGAGTLAANANGFAISKTPNLVTIQPTFLPNSVFFGINNYIASSAISYDQLNQAGCFPNLLNFDALNVQSSTNRLYIKGKNYCPANIDDYAKKFQIRIGEENNNWTIFLADNETVSNAIDGVDFNYNAQMVTSSSTNPKKTVKNISIPLAPYKLYFIFDTKCPVTETPITNGIAITELYFT